MPQERLKVRGRCPSLQEMHCEGVSKGVRRDLPASKSGSLDGLGKPVFEALVGAAEPTEEDVLIFSREAPQASRLPRLRLFQLLRQSGVERDR